MYRNKKATRLLLGVLLVSMLFTGCSSTNSSGNPQASANPVVTETQTPTPEPSPTATPAPTPKLSEGETLYNAYRDKEPIDYQVVTAADFQYNLKGVKQVDIVGAVTGEYSINKTKTNYNVGGTDLGIIFDDSKNIYVAFGDTFANEGLNGSWRSNVLAVTTDVNPADGILFDRMITIQGSKNAKEIIRSKKIDNLEMTVIPTGGFSIGDSLYICYMSVKKWGVPGQWTCNYGSIAKSTDGGETWTKLEDLKWPGDTHFAQLAPVVVDDYVYYFGITGGRSGPVNLMRTKVENVEKFDKYEYVTSLKDDGNPVWEKGEKAMREAYAVIDAPVGELSVMYNEYLEEWTVTYLGGANLVIRSSKTLWGPYSRSHVLVDHQDFPSLYGAFMYPKWVENKGQKIYFLMSIFSPIYNSILMEAELVK